MHFPPPIYSYLNQLSSLSSKLCCWLMKGWLYLDKAAEFCYSEMSAKQVSGWTVTGLVIWVKIIMVYWERELYEYLLMHVQKWGGYTWVCTPRSKSYISSSFSFYWDHILLGFPDWEPEIFLLQWPIAENHKPGSTGLAQPPLLLSVALESREAV